MVQRDMIWQFLRFFKAIATNNCKDHLPILTTSWNCLDFRLKSILLDEKERENQSFLYQEQEYVQFNVKLYPTINFTLLYNK